LEFAAKNKRHLLPGASTFRVSTLSVRIFRKTAVGTTFTPDHNRYEKMIPMKGEEDETPHFDSALLIEGESVRRRKAVVALHTA
jgi:hypothetical protein